MPVEAPGCSPKVVKIQEKKINKEIKRGYGQAWIQCSHLSRELKSKGNAEFKASVQQKMVCKAERSAKTRLNQGLEGQMLQHSPCHVFGMGSCPTAPTICPKALVRVVLAETGRQWSLHCLKLKILLAETPVPRKQCLKLTRVYLLKLYTDCVHTYIQTGCNEEKCTVSGPRYLSFPWFYW